MTYYHPCRGCKLNGKCPKKEAIANKISGLGITTLKLRCTERQPLFKAGERVSFNLTFFNEEDAYYDNGAHGVEFHGTISKEMKTNKFLVKVDDGPCVESEDYDYSAPGDLRSERGFVSLSSSRLTKLEEPDLTVKPCGNVEGQQCRNSICYCAE